MRLSHRELGVGGGRGTYTEITWGWGPQKITPSNRETARTANLSFVVTQAQPGTNRPLSPSLQTARLSREETCQRGHGQCHLIVSVSKPKVAFVTIFLPWQKQNKTKPFSCQGPAIPCLCPRSRHKAKPAKATSSCRPVSFLTVRHSKVWVGKGRITCHLGRRQAPRVPSSR